MIALASVLSIMVIAAAGLAGADTVMRDAFVQAAGNAPWASVDAQLHTAEALAPWEPTFGWAIGKAAIEALQSGSNLQAYSDGQKALAATRRVLPSDPAVVYDSAYLTLRYGIVSHDATPIRDALNAFVMLSEKDPNNPTYWSARGLAAALLGEFAEAERDLRTALLLSPRNGEYTKALQQVESAARSGQ
jgi:Flp pilus assembly protein TadD